MKIVGKTVLFKDYEEFQSETIEIETSGFDLVNACVNRKTREIRAQYVESKNSSEKKK